MLEVRGVAAGYGQAGALWDVSLRVEDGEVVTILGPNGAGKSTLVNVLGGLHRASGGSIQLDGRELGGVPGDEVCAAGIAVVPEGRRVFPTMTVLDNLDVGAYHKAARLHRDESYARVCEIFPLLADRSTQLAGSLSGGEQQMLAIGRALMSRPRLLLLDEPSLGLAPVIVEQIFEVVRQINQAGTSVLLVEQNVVDALELANRAYILEEGHIVREGLPAELLADEGLRAAYFGM
ncbi:MAG TPA: ABC transporter ATP-binding protein [Acidimicrobiia bacterium]